MKSIKRRLTFHFSFQFISLFICILLLLCAVFFILAFYLSNEEVKHDFPSGTLSLLVTDTEVTEDHAVIPEKIQKQIVKENMWYQVINESGKVIGEVNTPEGFPDRYSLAELVQMEETKKIKEYHLVTSFEKLFDVPSYYVLGYENDLRDELQNIYEKYQGKLPNEKEQKDITQEIVKNNASLQILNSTGHIVVSFREEREARYRPLELIDRKFEPGKYDTTTTNFYDKKTGCTWVFHTPNRQHTDIVNASVIKQIIIVVIVIAVTVLLATIAFAVWNAFRYGGPLLLFTSWLERMGNGNYSEVLTDKEKKRVFRKNGKVRFQYRLYEEVIKAFYKMAEKLSATEKERTKLELTREEWMTGISHDLRTPISTIQGYGHMLESGQYKWTEAELKEIGETLRQKGEYMVELVEDFSLAFKLKNQAIPLETKPLEINQFLQNVVLKFVNDRTIQDVHFVYQPLNKKVLVEVDKRWFERMLDNIIFNAIKHNPPHITIHLSISVETEFISIEVKDDGVGMDKSVLENLFERYYRGTNTSEKKEGSGLGMNIAKAICELHGGHIVVRSAPGVGTTITMRLPILR